ncbi:MAG: TPM domain-containing protein [Myxococcaceae bacterium]
MRIGALAATLLLSFQALALDASQVPRPPRGRWAVDLTGRIRHPTLADLDRIAGEVDVGGGGQLGVAVVDSTSGAPHRDFATAVFNRWGVGHAGRNDGVLLFVALADRKAEIVLGDGLLSVPTFETDRIMRDDIVANFRRGDPDAALVAGAHSLAGLLARRVGAPPPSQDAAPVSAPELPVPADVEELHAILVGSKPFPSPRPHGWVIDLEGRLDKPTLAALNRTSDEVYASGRGRLFVLLYRSAPRYAPSQEVAALAQKELASASGDNLYLVVVSTNPKEASFVVPELIASDSDGRRELDRIRGERRLTDLSADPGQGLLIASQAMARMALEGPPTRPVMQVAAQGVARNCGSFLTVLGALAVGAFFGIKRYLRRRPRRCSYCGQLRELLAEQADDVHLTEGQRKEEQLGSVDHDVWHCDLCNDVQVVSHQAWFSSYARCKSCDFRTVKSQSKTLVAATYDHGGTVQVTETCTNCNAVNSYQRHTSRLTRSTSSSSSSFGSSRSSFGGGRSSFGGGSSSGRGSSGSW